MHDVSSILNSIKPCHVKICLMSIATNKGADQPAHLNSLISIFLFAAWIAGYLLTFNCATCFWGSGGWFEFYLVGLEIPKTHFRMIRLNSKLIILKSAVTKWDRGVAGSSLTKRALSKHLIFVCVWGGVPLNGIVLGQFRYPESGVVLECIDSWSFHPYLL